jgi:hypothetical protein
MFLTEPKDLTLQCGRMGQHRMVHLLGIRLIQNENRNTSWRNSVVVDSHSHIVSMKYRLNNFPQYNNFTGQLSEYNTSIWLKNARGYGSILSVFFLYTLPISSIVVFIVTWIVSRLVRIGYSVLYPFFPAHYI